MERERERQNPVRERQLCSGDVGFVTWRSLSYIRERWRNGGRGVEGAPLPLTMLISRIFSFSTNGTKSMHLVAFQSLFRPFLFQVLCKY